MLKPIGFACLFLAYTAFAFCQVNDFANKKPSGIIKEATQPGWIKFTDSTIAKADEVFTKYKTEFALTDGHEMKLAKKKVDEIGFTHSKFQQYYKGILIAGAEFIIHEKNNQLQSANGKIYTPKNIQSNVLQTEAAALQKALSNISSTAGYYWQDKNKETKLKNKTKNQSATYYPKATMVYILAEDSTQLILCYRFFVKALDFGKSCWCFVNAATGAIEKKITTDLICDPTTFQSNYNGTQTLYTNDVAVIGNSYDLEDDCQASIFTVYDRTDGDAIFNTSNNQWATDWQRSAASSLWAVKASWYWFNTFFGRNGHDNDGADIDIYQGVNFGTAEDPNNYNAAYSYDQFGIDQIAVGVGDEARVTDDINALDIMAHEFTHGVTQFEANLVYEKEPGALNESFSDIFGQWIEYKVRGNTDWYNGADRINTNGCPRPTRSLINPLAKNVDFNPWGTCKINFTQPNTYASGPPWVPTIGCTPIGPNQTGDNDYCGVHINSGVQNQMFYLLSVGGAGWNDGNDCHASPNNGFEWQVTGIGIDKAIRIAYRVLCDYLGSQSGYADARNSWVHAAVDLYGECSFEAIQTGRAWQAVGIAPPNQTGTLFPLCNDYGNTPITIRKNGQINIAGGCNVNILPTGNLVNVEAKNKIHIYAGFRSIQGSNFRAAISDECRFATY